MTDTATAAPPSTHSTHARQTPSKEQVERQIERWAEKIKKLELDIRNKDDNKEVALGTSKINYMDPRISVAWCKRVEVPIEKVFAKTLRDKVRPLAWLLGCLRGCAVSCVVMLSLLSTSDPAASSHTTTHTPVRLGHGRAPHLALRGQEEEGVPGMSGAGFHVCMWVR